MTDIRHNMAECKGLTATLIGFATFVQGSCTAFKLYSKLATEIQERMGATC